MTAATPPLLGRAREREALDRLLHGVLEERRGGVLVVHGEAGVGKNALLDYTVAAARRFRIARTFGVEAEMEHSRSRPPNSSVRSSSSSGSGYRILNGTRLTSPSG